MIPLPALPAWAWRWIAFGLAALALVGAGVVLGQKLAYDEVLDREAKAALEGVRIVTKQGAVTEKIVTQYRDRVQVQQGITTTIEKEVTRYVESKPLALACLLEPRWVQLHDAAAAGAVPPAAAGADAAGAGVAAPEALRTITGNYATYRAIADRLSALQAWVRGQYETTNGEELSF